MGTLAISAVAGRLAWSAPHQKSAMLTRSLFDDKTLDGWVQCQNDSTSLSVGSILDQDAFAEKLANGQDPVSVFLRGQLDGLVKIDLTTYASTNTNAAALLSAIVKQISQLLAGPSIFSAGGFRDATLRPETQALLRQNPHGEPLARLNRMLLEDAYPVEIAKSVSSGWIVKNGVMTSTGAGRGVIYTAQDYSRYRLIYTVRHVSGHPDHQAGVLIFCKRPKADELPLDALGGIQFQLPMGSYWDYRPGHDNPGTQFFKTITKSPFDRHAWSHVELLVDAGKGTARLAVAQPPGSKAIELVDFSDPTAGRPGPIAWQMHNGGLFDEYKDINIEIDPQYDDLLTTRTEPS
jgi:ligand-binding SRPBCC domain-containing protein